MSLNELNAISPIDGRYRNKVASLAPYFSEEALIKYRVQVEIEYFIALCEIPLPQLYGFDNAKFTALREIYSNFDTKDAEAIKEIEKTTNHDVKAVEYFIKNAFDTLGLSSFKEFIHFGLTSQDINNTAIPLSIKEAMNSVYVPQYFTVLAKLEELSKEWATIPMLANPVNGTVVNAPKMRTVAPPAVSRALPEEATPPAIAFFKSGSCLRSSMMRVLMKIP